MKLPGDKGYDDHMEMHNNKQRQGINLEKDFQKHTCPTQHKRTFSYIRDNKKCVSDQKWNGHEFHVQGSANFYHSTVKMSFNST